MGQRTPRYGLSLPNRGVLFGATSSDELLAVSEQADYSPSMTREYIEGWLAYGPPAAVLEKIRAYVDVGCTTPILRFASWDQKGQLARALTDLMPAALALRLPA